MNSEQKNFKKFEKLSNTVGNSGRKPKLATFYRQTPNSCMDETRIPIETVADGKFADGGKTRMKNAD